MLEHMLNGGPIMIPLMLLSVLALAVIVDRIRAFREALSPKLTLASLMPVAETRMR